MTVAKKDLVTAYRGVQDELIIGAVSSIDVLVTAEAQKIDAKIAALTAQGWPEDMIIDRLLYDLDAGGGQIFGALISGADSAFAELDSQLQQINLNLTWGSDLDTPMQWVAVMDSATCPECIALHGAVKTYREWLALGVPGQQASSCNIAQSRCRCKLVPVEDARKIGDPIVLSGEGGTRQELLDKLTSRPSFDSGRLAAIKRQYGIG